MLDLRSVSNEGLIVAYKRGYRIRKDGMILNPNCEILKGRLHSGGYIAFKIVFNKKFIDIQVHRLVAYQKYGNKLFSTAILVRHKDNDKFNNSHDNILIGNVSDNWHDIPKSMRVRSAIDSHRNSVNRKYSDADISEVRLLSRSMTVCAISNKTGICHQYISDILMNKVHKESVGHA